MIALDQKEWHRANDEYIGEAIRWVRARLRGLAAANSRQPGGELQSEIQTARQTMEAAGNRDDLPMRRLARTCGLSTFEQDCLLLCTAMELDLRVAALCGAAQGDPSRCHPTFALALALFDGPTWDAISPHRPLRKWHLINVARNSQTPLIASPLQADERIVNYLKGLNQLDARLTYLLKAISPSQPASQLSPSQYALAGIILTRLQSRQITGHSTQLVQLLGADLTSKQMIAAEVCASLGLQLYRLSPAVLDAANDDFETTLSLLSRETRLSNIAIFLSTEECADARRARLEELIETVGGIFFVESQRYEPGLQALVAVDIEKPTPVEQQQTWRSRMSSLADEEAAVLAGQFRLNLPEIDLALERATRVNAEPAFQRVWSECRRLAQPRLDELAQRVDVKATWSDLVLPPDVRQLLVDITDQVRHRSRVLDEWGFREKLNRGFGTTALFAGESGTGKTMAAEVIAGELQLDLYRVDLSTIISKFIGDTEKMLSRLFRISEDSGVALFFDEADALFGRRSEVKDSHDRFANVQINYLLQRMESYRGLAILASNFKSALDSAFLRRLRFVVQFPFPEASQRREIWQRVFPARTPVGRLDYDRLARLHLNGGNIHNIAMNAAFAAAAAKSEINMPVVLDAARAEFVKSQKPLNLLDFQWVRQEVCT